METVEPREVAAPGENPLELLMKPRGTDGGAATRAEADLAIVTVDRVDAAARALAVEAVGAEVREEVPAAAASEAMTAERAGVLLFTKRCSAAS